MLVPVCVGFGAFVAVMRVRMVLVVYMAMIVRHVLVHMLVHMLLCKNQPCCGGHQSKSYSE